jgi:hypothetical protein
MARGQLIMKDYHACRVVNKEVKGRARSLALRSVHADWLHGAHGKVRTELVQNPQRGLSREIFSAKRDPCLNLGSR